MFEKIKQLSKDTAVYGISTMVGRLLNFILVPFYTHVFLPAEYGIIINIYAFIGILIIIYQYGMDSAYMKYDAVKSETKSDNFSTAYFSVIAVSILLSMLILVFKLPIGGLMEVPGNLSHLIYYVAAILFLDAAGIIPFITLRLERKAKKFAAFKIINISTNAALKFNFNSSF
jgi:O-antigen/teichoic acid export membrane protein